MRQGDLVKLETKPRAISDIIDYVVDACRGKSVLNIGALGDVKYYLPNYKNIWLHEKILQVANDSTALDLDEEGCKWAKEHGYDVIHGDCETMELNKQFDVIVMYEVIEHLNAPVTALSNILKHLKPNGSLIITTPNPTAFPLVVSTFLNRQPNVFYDHVCEFSPENIQAISDRLRVKLTDVAYFTRHDSRSKALDFKSYVLRGIGSVLPRCHYQFAAVVKHN